MSDKRFPLLAVALVILVFASMAGCDFGASDDLRPEDSFERAVTYSFGVDDGGNEIVVTALLDKSFHQEHQTFQSMEHYHEELDAVEEERELRVNAALYISLSHAITPAEISMLDNYGAVTIGAYEYTVTEVAVYRQSVLSTNAPRELVEFWGEDGLALAKELSQLYGALHRPNELASMNFINPAVDSIAKEIVAGRSAKLLTYDKIYKGPINVCLPDYEIVSGVTRNCYPIQYLMWNQSTGRFRRRAHAGTQMEVQIGGDWVSITDSSVPDDAYVGIGLHVRLQVTAKGGKGEVSAECNPILERGPLDYTRNPPYEYLSGAPCYAVWAIAKRKRRVGATSEHGGGTHDYFRKTWVPSYNSWYLMYSASAVWHYSYVDVY